MRSKWGLWLVAILVGSALAFPSVISAAEKAAQPGAPAKEEKKMEKQAEKPKAKTMSATGEVVSVDAAGGMLAVKVKDKEMSFTAAKKALEKVKAGDRVRVSYTEKDGKMMARSVTAAPVKKAEAKKAEKKEGMKEQKKEKM